MAHSAVSYLYIIVEMHFQGVSKCRTSSSAGSRTVLWPLINQRTWPAWRVYGFEKSLRVACINIILSACSEWLFSSPAPLFSGSKIFIQPSLIYVRSSELLQTLLLRQSAGNNNCTCTWNEHAGAGKSKHRANKLSSFRQRFDICTVFSSADLFSNFKC